MSTIPQDVAKIRNAIYGSEVREAIADGIENINAKADQVVTDYGGVPARVTALETAIGRRKVLDVAATKISGTTDQYLLSISTI